MSWHSPVHLDNQPARTVATLASVKPMVIRHISLQIPTKLNNKCHVPHLGPKLWSSSSWYLVEITCKWLTSHELDWHLLPCAVSFIEVLSNLPGCLSWNSHEIMPLKAFHWSFISFVNHHVSSETPDWSEGKLLCKQCVLKLMGQHILNSLWENKAQHGSPFL